jgi:hypothetical protein
LFDRAMKVLASFSGSLAREVRPYGIDVAMIFIS